MQKVIHKFYLKDEPNNDAVYWETKSENERLAALEQLRKQFIILFSNGNRPRFQRIYTAFKQA